MYSVKKKIHCYPPKDITGKGIGIAVLDTGICPMDDFVLPQNRIIEFRDFVNNIDTPYDDNGHGTHVAGIAASNGILSDGIYSGIAPQSNIISLKILDEAGHGTLFWALEAVKWVIENKNKYNIRVVNMSIGTNDKTISPALLNAAKSLFISEITVCAAAGNENCCRISAPGTSPYVITAGSIEEMVRFKLKSNNSYYIKPDVFAPSENIISCKADGFSFSASNRSSDKTVDEHYISMSGTSMATPMVSAAAALLYQYNTYFSPKDIKRIFAKSIVSTNGILNIENLFKFAK